MVSLSEQIKTLQGFSPDLFIYFKIKDNKLWMLLIQIFGRNLKHCFVISKQCQNFGGINTQVQFELL